MKKPLKCLVCALLALALAGCAKTQPEPPKVDEEPPAEPEPAAPELIKVGFAQAGHESDRRAAATADALRVFCADSGYELRFSDADLSSGAQLRAVETFLDRGVDYILVSPVSEEGWDGAVSACGAAGVPVIALEGDVPGSACRVGTDGGAQGEICGRWLAAYAGERGIGELRILIVGGETERIAGFRRVAEQEGWTIVDAQSGGGSEDGGRDVMGYFCGAYPGGFNAVICDSDAEAVGAASAMGSAGVGCGEGRDVILAAFGGGRVCLQYMLDGWINAVFEASPLTASAAADVIAAMERGETPPEQVSVDVNCFAASDAVRSFDAGGRTYEPVVVTAEIIGARPY